MAESSGKKEMKNMEYCEKEKRKCERMARNEEDKRR